jgi:uroporphyrinogen-III synthase
VLVTRPQAQATGLCDVIGKLGGEPVAFPAMEIEPLAAATLAARYDLTIFTSTNAVHHGLPCLARENLGQVAAIGTGTRAALTAQDIPVHLFPEGRSNSEALLTIPAIASLTDARVLIVRGCGGRELLRDRLQTQRCAVEVLEVYQRVPARPSAQAIAAIEQRWSENGIDIVTATSAEIIQHLHMILGDAGRTLLKRTPILVVSERVRDAARALGLEGECLLATGADDTSLVGTLATWRTRARALEA